MSVPSAMVWHMDDDGRTGEGRARMARGTARNAVATPRRTVRSATIAPSTGMAAAEEPARSIAEAVERLVAAREADEALAEWMRGGA